MSLGTSTLVGLVLPESLEEKERSEDGRRTEFTLQPLERGFGHTIGNSIRRILLSSLPGAAVWAFRADGVQHEHFVEARAGDQLPVCECGQERERVGCGREEGAVKDPVGVHLAHVSVLVLTAEA